MAEPQQQPSQDVKKTYRGNCHCAAYIYEVNLPEIKTAHPCNCSICHKKAVLWPSPAALSDFKFVKGEMDTLSSYTFGKRLGHHKFCPTCGTALLYIGHLVAPRPGEEKEPVLGVNIRAIHDLDIWSLELEPVDGASYPPVYEAPKFTGPEPTGEVDGGGKLYTGSCHCGAVRLAVKCQPLDKDYNGKISECNCSICVRNGYTWLYPNKDQVVIQGKEKLNHYFMGNRVISKSFCKTCGVQIHGQAADLSEEEAAALPENVQKWFTVGKLMCPVNLKVMEGVDLSNLKIDRFDGWNMIQPPYINP